MAEIRRIHHPYTAWEDYAAGLYGVPTDLGAETMAARRLLADRRRCLNAMRAVVHAWPISAEHQLSNAEQNRRAWLGQAACRHAVGATGVATRAAWPQLSEEERQAANRDAETVVAEWEEDQGLFLFDDGKGEPCRRLA